jgi:hypothetical protein
MAYIDFAYLCELAQFGRIGLALLSVRDSDHGLDLILATFYSLLGFRSRWRNSLNQDSGQAIAKCFKIGLFLRGYHQQGGKKKISQCNGDANDVANRSPNEQDLVCPKRPI